MKTTIDTNDLNKLLKFGTPESGRFVKIIEPDNDGAERMYVALDDIPEDAEITAANVMDAYTYRYDTGETEKGTIYNVTLTLCEIDADGDESEIDDWGDFTFPSDGKGDTLDWE